MNRARRTLRPLLAFICSFSWVILVAAQINPVNVGHTNNGGNAYGIVVSGNHAYLANGTDGLRIYDVSNPAVPLSVGHTNNGGLALGGTALNVAVLGTYAYLANYSDGLRVYDVSDPAKPSNVSHTNLPPWLRSLAFYNNYAYLGGDSVIGIFDITDPAFPVKASQPHVPENPNSMVVLTNEAWLLSASFSGLRVYDISNPTNLVSLGQTNNVGGGQGVAVSGNYAYLANGPDGLRIYDISNPTKLVTIGHTNNGGSAYSVVLSGSYAYLANGSDGLRIYDVSNPTAPINVGHANDGGLAQGLAVSGSYVYLANGADGLRIYALEPQLSIGLTRTNTLLFSWPSSLAGFNLQQNPDLKPANWLVVTNAPTTLGGQNQIITPLPGRSAFYRLYSP